MSEEREKLEPCPFCGFDDCCLLDVNGDGKSWQATCECGALGPIHFCAQAKFQAIDLWNHRASLSKTPESEEQES